MIELVHLEKRYENAVPLADVNAVINDGDVISIIGPSGTGKSTLIRCIDMLERPTGGKIILDGEDICAPGYDVTKARRKMGMVFQSFNLFGHLNVIENIMQAQIDILKRPKNEAYETGMKLLRRVGLASPEAACRHRSNARDGPRGHIVRRTHERPRPHDGGRGAVRDPQPDQHGQDHAHCDA